MSISELYLFLSPSLYFYLSLTHTLLILLCLPCMSTLSSREMKDLLSHFRHQVPDSGNDESVSAVPVYLQDKHRACLVIGWGLRGQSFRFTIGAQHETSMRGIDILSLEWNDICIDTTVPCIHVRNGKQDAETGVWRPITSALVKMLKVRGNT